MPSLYKSEPGRRIIAHWCRARLHEWPVAHRVDRIAVGGTEVHLTFVGDGPPEVVFVPGTNFNAATCLAAAEALGARWPTMIVDVPGQPGLSGGARPRRLKSWYGETLSQVLAAVDARDAVVVGNSLGAAIALACGSDRIAARVLYSPGGIVPLRTDALLLRRSTAWLARPTPERSRALLELFVAPGSAPPEPLVSWMELVARYCRSTLAPAPLPADTLARGAKTPLVVATGEYDRFLPPERLAPEVEAKFGRTLRVLPGVGHLAAEERPEDAVALVEEAISLIDAKTA